MLAALLRSVAPALAALGLAVAAHAASPEVDYVLHCQGCHLADGSASPGRVPALLLCLLTIVMRLTQRLPIGFIPEQRLVALVRDDVIDHLGSRHP